MGMTIELIIFGVVVAFAIPILVGLDKLFDK